MSSKPIEFSIFGHRIVLVVCIDHINAVDVVCLDLIYLIRLVYSTAATTEFKANITILALEISKHTCFTFFLTTHIWSRDVSNQYTLVYRIFECSFWTYIYSNLNIYFNLNPNVPVYVEKLGCCIFRTFERCLPMNYRTSISDCIVCTCIHLSIAKRGKW